jgi:Lon protease-like protein
MDSSEEIAIPEIVPVMTLQGMVFFPHAVMPLFIFEPRYQEMLGDVLQKDRLFAVFNESDPEPETGEEEPPARMGTVGVIRASHKNPDGTANLALQGLVRVRLVEIVRESPYRLIRVETCPSEDDLADEGDACRSRILSLIDRQPALTEELPEEYLAFIQSIAEPEAFIDVSIHTLCRDCQVKQKLLETTSLARRYDDFEAYLRREEDKRDLYQQLQGDTRDEEIDLN